MKNKANIMLLGRTGAGKSSFINYLLDTESAPTGCGEPITQSFDEYSYILKNGFQIRIFDSKGLEVDGYSDAAKEIELFAKEKCDSKSLSDWIHGVFYCININRARLEPEEEQFIKNLQAATRQAIHIIITHCRSVLHSLDELAMIEKIKTDLGSSINVFCVNSVEERKRTGEKIPKFGKESIIRNLVDLLWDITASRISVEYADQLRSGLHKLINGLQKEYCGQIDACRWVDLVQNKSPELSLDNSTGATIHFIDDMNCWYETKIQAFLEMYCSFVNAFKSQHIEQCSPYAFSYNALLDDSLDYELQKWHAAEEKELQQKVKSGRLEMLWHGLGYYKNIRTVYKEPVIALCKAMKKRVPSEEKIQEDVYAMLLHAKEHNLRSSTSVRLNRKISVCKPCLCGSGCKLKRY